RGRGICKRVEKAYQKMTDVSNRIEKLTAKPDELAALRLEVAQAFYEALKSESKTQHEKSHLLESYESHNPSSRRRISEIMPLDSRQ
ncbi:MAG: hypothetical protein QME40_07865, partial [bacterium]|nr:hypothetical protein [bacterium]